MQPAKNLIEAFEGHAQRHPGPVPHSLAFDSGKPGLHAIFSSIIHGNEVGSLPAVLELVSKLANGTQPFVGRFSFVLGNVPASLRNERFLEADLNRQFAEGAEDSAERRRALELMPFLKTADLLVDFHQTNAPCHEPFFIFAYEENSYLWARATGAARVLVTRSAKEKFTQNSLCIDEYTRQFQIPSLTIELGQAGLNDLATARTKNVLDAVVEGTKKLSEGKTTLRELADQKPELEFLSIVHREPVGDRTSTLKPGYENLGTVSKGEVMGTHAKGEFVAPLSAKLIFPKYPKRDADGLILGPLNGEMFMLLLPLPAHPRTLF